MKLSVLITFLLLSVFDMPSSTTDPVDFNLNDYRWENRVILLFAEDSTDEQYQNQVELLHSEMEGLDDRDLLLVSVFLEGESQLNGQRITDESASELRGAYWDEAQSFTFILIGKDGGVKIRADEVVEADQLFGRIDSMPMRQREMRENGR